MRLYDNERQFAAEANERAVKKTYGYEMKRLTGGECRELEPALSPMFIAAFSMVAGISSPIRSGRLSPSQLMSLEMAAKLSLTML